MWKPIETAPKDGTYVLVCRATDVDGNPIEKQHFRQFVHCAAWWPGENDWIVYNSQVQELPVYFQPTHWDHVPDPPDGPASVEIGKPTIIYGDNLKPNRVVQQLGVYDLKWSEHDGTLLMGRLTRGLHDGVEEMEWIVVPIENMSDPKGRMPVDVEDAIRIAGLWRVGKMIGGYDPDEVRDALLGEIERLRTWE